MPGCTWRPRDVLDANGRDLRVVVFPESFDLKAVRNGRAYGVTTTEDDVHTVEIYRLRDVQAASQ